MTLNRVSKPGKRSPSMRHRYSELFSSTRPGRLHVRLNGKALVEVLVRIGHLFNPAGDIEHFLVWIVGVPSERIFAHDHVRELWTTDVGTFLPGVVQGENEELV